MITTSNEWKGWKVFVLLFYGIVMTYLWRNLNFHLTRLNGAPDSRINHEKNIKKLMLFYGLITWLMYEKERVVGKLMCAFVNLIWPAACIYYMYLKLLLRMTFSLRKTRKFYALALTAPKQHLFGRAHFSSPHRLSSWSSEFCITNFHSANPSAAMFVCIGDILQHISVSLNIYIAFSLHSTKYSFLFSRRKGRNLHRSNDNINFLFLLLLAALLIFLVVVRWWRMDKCSIKCFKLT